MGILDRTQLHKEIGAIAVSAKRQGLDVAIIIGKTKIQLDGVPIYETGFSQRNWITKILDPIISLKHALHENPEYCLLYNIENYGNIILIIVLKLFRKIFSPSSRNVKILIKADTDGSFVNNTSRLTLLIYRVLIYCYSKITGGILVETNCALEKIMEFTGNKSGLFYLPDGYFDDIIRPVPYEMKKRLVVCVARIVHTKNLEAVVRLYNRISNVYMDVNFKIIGSNEDQNYFDKLKRLILQMNMQNEIEFETATYEQLSEILAQAYVSVSMSLKESFGIARMESLGSGTPVVTYDVGCGNDFVNFGAIVVPIGEEDSMFSEVSKLLSNESYWKEKCKNASRSAISWHSVVQRMIYLFETCN